MLLVVICQLFITPLFCWLFLGTLGYHGVFALLIFNLLISSYFALWSCYLCWIWKRNFIYHVCNWIEIGNGSYIDVKFVADIYLLLIIFIMTIGSFIVLLFVYVEMWDDKEGANFAILLVLFLGFMTILLTSGNLLIFYIGWEGIGMTSLFLVNFWSERSRGVKATLKIFIINKIGDFLLLTGIFLMFSNIGSVDFEVINSTVNYTTNNWINFGIHYFNIQEISMALMVIGGGVKSAQFGFHIWLLEAMEAPLGASALMHSSTLVIAGVILVFKLRGAMCFTGAPYILVYWGSFTAVYAAFAACWQFELKLILAYSTTSSMGCLYFMLGVGALDQALKYLIIHAIIKIFLFLIVGAIIIHCNGCQDIRWMGNLANYIPGIYVLFIAGSLGLAGIPYWSGYCAKVELWRSTRWLNILFRNTHGAIICSTWFTYAYLSRVIVLVFLGSKNGHHSIYKLKNQSYLVLISHTIFMIAVMYSGVLWVKMLGTTSFGTHLQWTYNAFKRLSFWTSYDSWLIFAVIYCSSVAAFFTILVILLSNKFHMLRTWFLVLLSLLLSVILYTVL